MGKMSGFTFFELAVAVALIGVLSAILLSRVVFYQEQVEIARVQRLVASLRSALQLKAATLFIAHRYDQMERLAEENPMSWLVEAPTNYVGEYYAPDKQKIPDGNWYFDRQDRTLVYLPNSRKLAGGKQSKLLKFNVKLRNLFPNATTVSGFARSVSEVALDQEIEMAAVNQ